MHASLCSSSRPTKPKKVHVPSLLCQIAFVICYWHILKWDCLCRGDCCTLLSRTPAGESFTAVGSPADQIMAPPSPSLSRYVIDIFFLLINITCDPVMPCHHLLMHRSLSSRGSSFRDHYILARADYPLVRSPDSAFIWVPSVPVLIAGQVDQDRLTLNRRRTSIHAAQKDGDIFGIWTISHIPTCLSIRSNPPHQSSHLHNDQLNTFTR